MFRGPGLSLRETASRKESAPRAAVPPHERIESSTKTPPSSKSAKSCVPTSRSSCISHVRPDGDAIGSQLALGFALMAMGKSVRLINEDGLPENLAFLRRLGANRAAAGRAAGRGSGHRARHRDQAAARRRRAARRFQGENLAQHRPPHFQSEIRRPEPDRLHQPGHRPDSLSISSPRSDLPMPAETRDAIYVAVSTDTGSFQYPSTTAKTYEMAADLIRRGLDVGTINSQTYDEHPLPPPRTDARAAQHAGTLAGRHRRPLGRCATRPASISRCARRTARDSSTSSARSAACSWRCFSKNCRMEKSASRCARRTAARRLQDRHGVRRRRPRAGGRHPHEGPLEEAKAAACSPPIRRRIEAAGL